MLEQAPFSSDGVGETGRQRQDTRATVGIKAANLDIARPLARQGELRTHICAIAAECFHRKRQTANGKRQTANDGILGKINTYDYTGTYIAWTTDGAHADSVFYRKNMKFSITNACGILSPRKENNVDFRFLHHILAKEAEKHVSTGTGNPKLTSNVMASMKIPIPASGEQHRIVSILDKFDTLVNDISIGLPAGINTRRQQYEYYRDRLLTFRESA